MLDHREIALKYHELVHKFLVADNKGDAGEGEKKALFQFHSEVVEMQPGEGDECKRTPVVSSNIASAGWLDGRLEIEFKNGGDVYRYYDVGYDTHKKLIAASSVGQYFHEHINGKYKYEKISDERPQD